MLTERVRAALLNPRLRRAPLLHQVVDQLITRHVVVALADESREGVHDRLHGHRLRPVGLGLSPLFDQLLVDLLWLELSEKFLEFRVIFLRGLLLGGRGAFCDFTCFEWLHINEH